ncbi:anti-anti-sigma factor [Marmoricola sp. OAE513]|uniref:STAS domain-containing protein n=1 Tax=Marmoricola sp. OAE513 TaxID=2817894 RepID=UPI001AE8432A
MPDQHQPDDACSLAVSGEIDIASVEDLLEDARRCLEQGPQAMTLDLAGVTFIDSSGLGALVRIRNDAAQQGTQVTLDRMPATARRLFQVSGLDQVFEIRDEDEA